MVSGNKECITLMGRVGTGKDVLGRGTLGEVWCLCIIS